MLKPDGTGWHHRGIYTIAYTGEAYEMVALIMCLTRQTRYAADPWAVRNLADALRTEFILSRGWAMPHGTRGRMLGREPMAPGAAPWYGMGAAFAYLAMADDAVREAMGGLFMRLWDPDRPEHARMLALSLYLNFPCKATVGRRMMLERFAAENLPPAEDPPGLWIKPWGGLAVLRGEQWTLTVKGYSQYVWDFECHPASWAAQEENVFGRYVSHGHAQPMGTYRDDAGPYLGQNLDRGFNFCRFPGTTCKQVPPSMIYDPKTTWQTRWFSDETFLGGVHGPGGVGCFAMKLHDTSFDPSFRATKSWFFFGDTLVCLGSDIACDDASHPVQTTLFQAHLPEREHPMHVNGQAVTDLPWQLESRDALALVDPYDIGYLVPAGQNVTVQRARQAGRDIRNSGDAEGDYATALLDHGPAPGGAGYEYAILMRATPEAAGAFAAEPPYRLLQRDAVAHIVEHPGRGVISYALFTAGREIEHGPLLRADTPIAATAWIEDEARLTLRIADPDLRLPRKANMGFLTARDVEQQARPHTVQLLLRGQ